MSEYKYAVMPDPYCYKNTSVLKNKLGQKNEVNALHPFREGNGRANREFFRELSLKSGYKLQWELVQRDILLNADISAFNKDYIGLINALNSVCKLID